MKTWIRTIKDGKTLKDTVTDITDFSVNALTDKLRDVLLPMDIPTPVIIEAKAKHLVSFNVVRFKRDDFIESVDFDVMIIELLREKKPPHKRNPLDEV